MRVLKIILSAVALAVAGCGGGGGSDGPAPVSKTAISGAGVKGPLANALVHVYDLDPSRPDGKGSRLDSGSTNPQARINGLSIANRLTGPVLVEIVADQDTLDLTTGNAPVITRLVTILDAEALRNGLQAFPTPLSTMAVGLALKNADSGSGGYTGNADGATDEAELLRALPVAAAQVKSTFGFGLIGDVDIFTQPPMVTEDTVDGASQQRTLNFRTAVEAVAALAEKIRDDALSANPGSTATTGEMFGALVEDLADGAIDGNSPDGAIATFADISNVATSVTVDPSTLTIPGTATGLDEINTVLSAETGDTGVDTDTTSLDTAVADPAPAETVSDLDGDGTPDSSDTDNDNDTLSDADEVNGGTDPLNADTDGDGSDDATDAFPLDPAEDTDTDGDGTGNNADTDDDNDGTPDASDAFPLDPAEDTDTDGDGTGDNADTDDDNDGTPDSSDLFPLDPSEDSDTDSDGIGDNADNDDDNDGISDSDEATNGTDPLVADTDGDGVDDGEDAFPLDNTEDADTDGDGTGDNADMDDDNDGTPDTSDAFPLDAAEDTDADGDGTGANADSNDSDPCVPDDQAAACSATAAVWDQFTWDNANWQ